MGHKSHTYAHEYTSIHKWSTRKEQKQKKCEWTNSCSQYAPCFQLLKISVIWSASHRIEHPNQWHPKWFSHKEVKICEAIKCEMFQQQTEWKQNKNDVRIWHCCRNVGYHHSYLMPFSLNEFKNIFTMFARKQKAQKEREKKHK